MVQSFEMVQSISWETLWGKKPKSHRSEGNVAPCSHSLRFLLCAALGTLQIKPAVSCSMELISELLMDS